MQAKQFSCSYCDKKYESSRQLGGHISKAHGGLSASYAAKQITRKEREEDRYYLQLAKQELLLKGVDIKSKRQQVTKLKKEMMNARKVAW